MGSRSGKMAGDVVPKGYSVGALKQFTPEQEALFKQLFGHGGAGSFSSRLASGDQSMFDEMEAPAWRQFQQAQGDIASRFSQPVEGSMSARRGSGFNNRMTQATSDFAQDLQSRRMQIQRDALADLFSMSHELLGQRPTERAFFEKPQKQSSGSGFGSALGSGLGGLAGKGFGKLFGF